MRYAWGNGLVTCCMEEASREEKIDAWRACKLLGHSAWAWPANLTDWLAYFGLFEACKNGLKLGHNLGLGLRKKKQKKNMPK